VVINLPDGKYVGCVKDEDPISLEAIVDPPGAGWTYSWSKVAGSGSGNGTFNPSAGVESPDFKGTSKGELTVKVVVTDAGQTCEDTEDLVVIEINDLTEAVPLQFMDEYDVALGGYHTIPYSDPSDGDLQQVLISPIDDPDDPYLWIDEFDNGDFGAKVDHETGEVVVELRRSGVYLVKTVRENAGGETSTFFELSVDASDPGEEIQLKKGKAVIVAKPSADLILIGSDADDGFLKKARDSIGAGNYVKIGSVAAAITAIENYYDTHGQQPFTLYVLEHGKSGYQSMGDATQEVEGEYIAHNDPASAADLAAFTTACNEKVSACHLGGCNVGSPPNGAAFLQKLATDGNMTATAWDGVMSVLGSGKWYRYVGTTLVTKP